MEPGVCANCEREVDMLVKVEGYMVCLACEARHYELHHRDGWR